MATRCPEGSDYAGQVSFRSYKNCEKVAKKYSRLSCYDDIGGQKVCNNQKFLPVDCKNCKKWAKGRCSTPYNPT